MWLFQLVISFPPGVHPGLELLDHMVTLFLVFEGASTLYSKVVFPVYISINSVASLFSSVVSNSYHFGCLFDDSHSDWCEVISHGAFNLHYSND